MLEQNGTQELRTPLRQLAGSRRWGAALRLPVLKQVVLNGMRGLERNAHLIVAGERTLRNGFPDRWVGRGFMTLALPIMADASGTYCGKMGPYRCWWFRTPPGAARTARRRCWGSSAWIAEHSPKRTSTNEYAGAHWAFREPVNADKKGGHRMELVWACAWYYDRQPRWVRTRVGRG